MRAITNLILNLNYSYFGYFQYDGTVYYENHWNKKFNPNITWFHTHIPVSSFLPYACNTSHLTFINNYIIIEMFLIVHDSLFIICVCKCLMHIFTKFHLPTMFHNQATCMDPSLHILKRALQVIKSPIPDNIQKLCLCLK